MFRFGIRQLFAVMFVVSAVVMLLSDRYYPWFWPPIKLNTIKVVKAKESLWSCGGLISVEDAANRDEIVIADHNELEEFRSLVELDSEIPKIDFQRNFVVVLIGPDDKNQLGLISKLDGRGYLQIITVSTMRKVLDCRNRTFVFSVFARKGVKYVKTDSLTRVSGYKSHGLLVWIALFLFFLTSFRWFPKKIGNDHERFLD